MKEKCRFVVSSYFKMMWFTTKFQILPKVLQNNIFFEAKCVIHHQKIPFPSNKKQQAQK